MFLIAILLFFFSIINIFLKSNDFIILLLSIELLLISLSLFFLYYSYLFDSFFPFLFAFYILLIAASESAIGLTLFIIYSSPSKVKGS
jgi:NADH:ubiquinone oxidoreductase subunit K